MFYITITDSHIDFKHERNLKFVLKTVLNMNIEGWQPDLKL